MPSTGDVPSGLSCPVDCRLLLSRHSHLFSRFCSSFLFFEYSNHIYDAASTTYRLLAYLYLALFSSRACLLLLFILFLLSFSLLSIAVLALFSRDCIFTIYYFVTVAAFSSPWRILAPRLYCWRISRSSQFIYSVFCLSLLCLLSYCPCCFNCPFSCLFSLASFSCLRKTQYNAPYLKAISFASFLYNGGLDGWDPGRPWQKDLSNATHPEKVVPFTEHFPTRASPLVCGW